MSEIITNTSERRDPDRMSERQSLLDAFADTPQDDSIWSTAFRWVEAEDDQRGGAIADGLHAAELIDMAKTVRLTAASDRYDLMAKRASSGAYWFDIIEGFSSNQIRSIQKDIVSSWVNQEGYPVLFDRALDVGTGTGKSLDVLQENAEHVVGLDRNALLLAIAKGSARSNTQLVQGTVDALPFEDESFNIVTSLGLHAALDKQTATGFYKELARVMVVGGVYVASFYYSVEDDAPHEEMARFTYTSKAMLTDMIGDTVSGALEITERLEGDDKDALLLSHNLHEAYYDVVSEDGVTHNLVSVVTKN